MTQDRPSGSEGDGNSGDKPAAERHNAAFAIDAFRKDYERAQNNRTQHDGKTLFWNRLAGIGIGVYTFLTVIIAAASILAAVSAWCALKTTRDIFIADQRPIIWLTNHNATPAFYITPGKDTGQIMWNWEYTNYGKSPAIEVRYETYMSLDNAPYALTFGTDEKRPNVGAPIPPGKIDWDTVISKPGISAAEFARLLTIGGGVSISGVIHYADANGGSYETTFCLASLVGGAVAYRDPTQHCGNNIK